MKKRVCSKFTVILILGIESFLILVSCAGKTKSDNPEDYLRRATSLISQREFDRAKLVLDTIASNTRNVFGDESAEYAKVLNSIVECLRLGKQFTEAESLALSIIDLPVDDNLNRSKVSAFLSLGELYLELDEPDLAIEFLFEGRSFASSRLGTTDSSVSEITLLLHKVYFLESRYDSAAILAEQYLAIRSYQPNYLDSQYLWTLLDQSIWNADAGNCAEAESSIAKVLSEPTVNQPGNSRFLAEANLLLGSCKTSSGDFEKAIEYYEPALDFAKHAYQHDTPRLIPYLRWFGSTLFRMRKFQLADSLYNELLEISYRDPRMSAQQLSKILREKADIAASLGQSDEAKTLRLRADSTNSGSGTN